MEKKGQRIWPSNRKEIRKSSRKYLNTRGLNVLGEMDAGLFSIGLILAV